jgi:arsenate reductase (thioredoxin)
MLAKTIMIDNLIRVVVIILLQTTCCPIAFCQVQGTENKPSKPIILFVCEHGAARSVIASAYFNKLAKEKKLNYQAVFRGTSPDSTLSVATVMGLTKDGFNTTAWKPLLVTQADLNVASKVITFDCKLPFESSKPVAKWDGVPSISKDYNAARNEILKHVMLLVQELEKKK